VDSTLRAVARRTTETYPSTIQHLVDGAHYAKEWT
jgi:hypothetical protein